MALVQNPKRIRLAMLGLVEGNGHPYSWSAIINGYNREAMAGCPYPAIPEYLNQQPSGACGIPGAEVTHIWCDIPHEADKIAEAALIPNVVKDPREVIGQVDAVLIPTDRGQEHLDRAGPFIEAGLPVFIDKPLTDNLADLRSFLRWHKEGKPFLSTSCLRYSREIAALRERLISVGDTRLITMTMQKSWERYGIHAIEGVYSLLEPGGWQTAINLGNASSDLVHLQHRSGAQVVLAVMADLYGGAGSLNVYGTEDHLACRFQDTFFAFKTQLEQFVEYLRSGTLPFPFSETLEQIKILIAGIQSREQGGARIHLHEIQTE